MSKEEIEQEVRQIIQERGNIFATPKRPHYLVHNAPDVVVGKNKHVWRNEKEEEGKNDRFSHVERWQQRGMAQSTLQGCK